MFSNKRKTIGVFLERPTIEFQNLLCQGIISTAEKKGYNVAIFCPYGNYGKNDRHFAGDQMLFQLPQYEEFAGVIVALDTMEEKSSRKCVVDKIREFCHCPVISIREILEGASNLFVDNMTCMEGVIRHFIEKHGFKKLCFMSGPKGRWDADERLAGFLNIMKEYELPVEEHQIFYGDYWKTKGKEACDWFLNTDQMPEAIVCANDYMAVSVVSELMGRGIRVPEDICVCGYDGLVYSLSFTPSITTMRVPFFDMGKRAVELIDEKQENPKEIKDVLFQSEIVIRESCGCMETSGKEAQIIRRNEYEKQQVARNRDIQFDFLSIHLGECNTVEEIVSVLQNFVFNMEGISDYVICFCEDLEGRESHENYTDIIEARGKITDDISQGNVRIPFERKELLPKEFTSDMPQAWYFTPLHYQDQCYGYEAFHFLSPERTGNLYFTWNVSIGNKIRDLLMEHKMQGLIQTLESMYNRDALTGMYNRRGLETYGNAMFQKALQAQELIFLAIIDLDGMKQINDNYGHVEGDFALQKIRSIIWESCAERSISARTGGDEFVIFAKAITEAEGRAWLQGVDERLEYFNSSGEKEYKIHASHGYTCRIPGENDTMETFIKESDEEMYKNKVINKIKRGEALR